MEIGHKPDVYIMNQYGKEIHFRLTFEYLDERTPCADLEKPITISPKQIIPIVFRELKLLDSQTKKYVMSTDLNLDHLIMEAWEPGWEINRNLEPEEIDYTGKKGEIIDKTSNGSSGILSSALELLQAGWKNVKEGWNAPTQENKPPPKEPEIVEMNKLKQNEEWETPKLCVAVVPLENVQYIQIIVDPIRFIPMIFALRTLNK
jgi:hypothetical protein